jgi:hypothetical protein
MKDISARTFAGVAVKARALRFDTHLDSQTSLPLDEQDWEDGVMNRFVAEMERLAASSAV